MLRNSLKRAVYLCPMSICKQLTCWLFFHCLLTVLPAQEIRAYMDLQTHPCMHLAYGFFGKGLEYFDEKEPPQLSHKHLFTNVNYANYLQDNPGARILVNGAILPEMLVCKKRARQRILDQIAFVNDFVSEHQDKFAVARTPKEVRELVLNTDKTIVVHSIEGAKRLLDGPEDARFWAEQGVAFMTLIHLMDDEFGGAAVLPELTTKAINFKATFRKAFRPKFRRGLTEKGKQAIVWLADAGILTDLTHMSDASRTDALDVMEEHGIPPLVTHDMFKPLQNHPRGIPGSEIIRIYDLGGMVSLPLSGTSNAPYQPVPKFQRVLDSLPDHCIGSIDSYRLTYETVKDVVESRAHLLSENGRSFDRLTETQKVDLAIGFQSDFNGWVNHHRPRYGEEGCFELESESNCEAIELEGMAHPGMLDSHWKYLDKEGVDLEPLLRASEKFLQMWEVVLKRVEN